MLSIERVGERSGAARPIAPAETVYNAAAVDGELDAIRDGAGDVAGKRMAATAVLREALDSGRQRIREAFNTEHRSGFRAARSLSQLTDSVIGSAHRFVAEGLFAVQSRTEAERIGLAAVGGYGRGEMAPHSDVDLLFLRPYKATAWSDSVVEALLYLLWDLRLKVGHATRTVSECVRLAEKDMLIRTSLLERRPLAGDQALFEALDERLWLELFERTGPEFVEAKLAERDRRHERTGGSRYLIEPNVKESKGGLRDLQTLYWIAKYLYRADTPEELVDKGVFTSEEVVRFRQAEAHLWSVRCGLHYIAGRAQEKLSFDYQVELAEQFGYRQTAGQAPVERFMTRYFHSAKQVGDLTRIFCAALEHQHKKRPPLLGGVARFFSATVADNGLAGEAEWIERRGGRLMIADPRPIAEDPAALMRFFETATRRDILIHPSALRLISRHRRVVDDALKTRPEVGPMLVDLMTSYRDPMRALRRLSETGVLGRLIPEFGRVTGMMQFNMYHHYTVDEHTLLAVQTLHQLASGALKEEHPTETALLETLPDLRALTVALFFHDIGKGLPEDHSIAGARIARETCPLLGMSTAETELVAWLVEHHLAMSDVAQKRDITDPGTIRAFADLVRSPERLKLLYILTVSDIRAVGPGVWNGWKAQLLRQLYHETRAVLLGDDGELSRVGRIAAAKEALREELADWAPAPLEAHLERFFPPYWLGLDVETQAMHAEMMRDAAGRPLTMRIVQGADRAATKVAFYTSDHPGLFARMAGAFALAGASVVDARAYTSKDGMAVNTFWVQDEDDAAYDDPDRLERLQRQVERTLMGEIVPRDALRERRRLRRRERSFHVPPRVAIDNAASDTFTVVEVNGRDRVGLLHDLARALSSENVNISSAIIATYGEHAVDVFYVRDLFGMKIESATKRARVEKALLLALESGAGA